MTGEDFKKKREALGYSQEELAVLMGKTRVTISRWENSDKIHSTYAKLINELNQNDTSGSVNEENGSYTVKNKNGNKYTELKDHTYDVEVPLIPFSAYASFLESLETGTVNEDFETVTFNVDRVGRGNYKAFIVKGDSMNNGHINDTPDGAKVLGRELGRQHWKDGFRDNDYGWIVMCKKNIFHKDITDFNSNTGEITLHSRNESPEFTDFKLSLNDCYYIFKVIKRIF